jgi:DNA-binding SARP family transcriptional activator
MTVRVVKAKVQVPRTVGAPRSRLLRQLDPLWDQGLALVVAPAGSGKTTLLGQLASTAEARVGWYQAEVSEADPPALFAHVQRALGLAGLSTGDPWETVEQAAESLHEAVSDRTLLIVDDFHQLSGTPSEVAMERLIGYAPAALATVIGSRRPPAFNLARARLTDRLLEIGHNDLRFRTWEVEELFHRHYGEPLTPEQVAELTRRTEGWAAGLQFFRLAIRGKPSPERARLLADVSGGSAMFRGFLARDVLAELRVELRQFMIRTSPLGWLSAPLCEAFLGTKGARSYLAEAQDRQVFTESVGGDAYRYHEVLRSHLEDALHEQLGEAGARAEHRRAGALLEDAGRLQDAVRAYCRGEDWDAVSRLAGERDDVGPLGPVPSGTMLPPALANEPWALLSQARALIRSGRLRAAIERYAQAERGFGAGRGADACIRERVAAAAWVERVTPPASGWLATLRRATMRTPLEVVEQARGPEPSADRDRAAGNTWASGGDRLAIGLAYLLAGRLRAAGAELARVADAPHGETLLTAGGQLALGVVALVAGEPIPSELLRWAVDCLEPDVTWLAQLGWAIAQAGSEWAAAEADAVRRRCASDDNDWGAALAGVIAAELWLNTPSRVEEASVVSGAAEAVATFDRFGAGVLAAWAEADRAGVMARAGRPDARRASQIAERRAVSVGSDLARVRALRALEVAGGADNGQRELLAELASTTGVVIPERAALPPVVPSAGPTAMSGEAAPPTEFRCFGGLSVWRDGRALDLTSVKPRVRSLLRLLAMHSGRVLHRDAIVEALWPEHDLAAGTRSLQVAVSSLRQLLEPGVARGCSVFLVREGDGYLLAVPPGSSSDVGLFAEAMATARDQLRRGHHEDAAVAFRRAVDIYSGELLPEEGATEWVVKERHRTQMDAADAAAALAEHDAKTGDLTDAIRWFERSLIIDAYRDGIWRRLIALYLEQGDRAAASAARRRYRAMLRELDLGGADGSG